MADLPAAVRSKLQDVRELQELCTELGMVGSPSDEELQQLLEAQRGVADAKEDLAALLEQVEAPLPADQMEAMERLLVDCCTEGDGNARLVAAVLALPGHGFAAAIADAGLLALACADGNIRILERLLRYPNVTLEEEEVLPLASYNATRRVPLLKLLLESGRLDFSRPGVVEAVQPALQDMVADVCVHKFQGEDQADRLEVLRAILALPALCIDLEARDASDQTLFMRAIAAGQPEILSLIHEQRPVADLGRLLADGTTYLVRAVLTGTPETVRWLLAQPEVDADLPTPSGRAADIARMKGNSAALQLLLAAAPQREAEPLELSAPLPADPAPASGAQPGACPAEEGVAPAGHGEGAGQGAAGEDDLVGESLPIPIEVLTVGDLLQCITDEPPCVADTAPLREALFKVMAEGRGCGLVLGPARSLRGFLSEWDVLQHFGRVLAAEQHTPDAMVEVVSRALAEPVHRLLEGRLGLGLLVDDRQWPRSALLADFAALFQADPPVDCVAFCRREPAPHYRSRLAPAAAVQPAAVLRLALRSLAASPAGRRPVAVCPGLAAVPAAVVLDHSDPLHVGIAALCDRGLGCLPVRDGAGGVTGVLTAAACVAQLTANPAAVLQPVADVVFSSLTASSAGPERWMDRSRGAVVPPEETVAEVIQAVCDEATDWFVFQPPGGPPHCLAALALLPLLLPPPPRARCAA